MTDSKIALYSGVLQVIPVLLLALFLGGRRRLHPTIAERQRFTAPGWALAIAGAAAAAIIAASVALYVNVDYLLIDVVIGVVLIVLFVGLLGTVYEVAKSAEQKRRDHRGGELTETDD